MKNLKINLSREQFPWIDKTFDTVWYRGLLHKQPSNGISGRVFIIKFFLSGRSMKFINFQSSYAHEINADVTQDFLLCPTFLLYTNDLPKNILRSLANINADDYGNTTKIHLDFCGAPEPGS